jgi:cathepsin L
MSRVSADVPPELGASGDAPRGSNTVEAGSEENELVDSAFDAFVQQHGRDYRDDATEYEMRKALFRQRLAAAHAHNAKRGRQWKAAPTKFSDRTDAERKAVRGYKRSAQPLEHGISLLEFSEPRETLPESKSWTHLYVARHIKDQGACGSCWAIATTSVLEAHYEIYTAKGGQTRTFSPQQTLDCTPNPQACGGTGGCDGATVELGMGWILQNGLATDEEVSYTAKDGQCSAHSDADGEPDTMKGGHGDDSMQVLTQQRVAPSDPAAPSNQGGASFGLVGYHTLKRNDDYSLAKAVVDYGPVAVSASAESWFEYHSGIFDSCTQDTVVDHAITLYGFGKEHGQKYWHIRNSWGPEWGEAGFIRLKRHDDGHQHCGTDNDPAQGTGCKGGPSSVTVCGMCGVLYDSVVPRFVGSGNGSAQAALVAGVSNLVRAEAKRH